MDKKNQSILYHPIGIIHTPYKEASGTPIQPIAAPESEATIEVFFEYAEGLTDIGEFSHLILIYHMHLVKTSQLKLIPFLSNEEHGVFSTRAPGRPNPIGFSVVKLEKVNGNLLFITGIDIIDGSPLLDIKPFIPAFDGRSADKTGWFHETIDKISKIKDDGRFC